MTIAAVGAVILGEFGEAATLAFLFSISEALEGYAMARTRRGLRALMALVPERVTVRRDGQESEIDPAGLEVGDVMIVRPGDRLATDGVVRSGPLHPRPVGHHRRVAARRGRSRRRGVRRGDQRRRRARGRGRPRGPATAPWPASSTSSRRPRSAKGSSQRLAERVARPLVPGIMVVAAGVAVVGSIARRSPRSGSSAPWSCSSRPRLRVRHLRPRHGRRRRRRGGPDGRPRQGRSRPRGARLACASSPSTRPAP